MWFTVIWIEQGCQFHLPYDTWIDAAEHAKWLINQGTQAQVQIEEGN
jgi:hypothetical protein